MRKITLFIMERCPYCQAALRYMDALYAENAEYASLEVEIIDELVHPGIAKKYDYYYVPAYYVGNKKLHEGAASMRKIRRVFDAALKR